MAAEILCSSLSLDALDKVLEMVRVIEWPLFAKIACDLCGSLG
ncbi:hypothetical protein [Rhizobium herbae]